MNTAHEETAQKIKELLKARFTPAKLEVVNESQLHAKHKEAKKHPKAGHFRIIIESADFAGKSLIQQHRMVYECLAQLMNISIHALALETRPHQ